MIFPTEKDFLKLTRKGNLIPVYKEIVADLETPVSAFYRVGYKAGYSFLLESVEGEEKIARFSFLAKNPELVLETKNKTAKITRMENGTAKTKTYEIKDTPLSFVRDILQQYKFVPLPDLPRFCGGLVGFASYDMVRFFERLPERTKDDLKLPDALFVLAKDIIIFDHRNHKIKAVSCAHVKPKSSEKAKLKAYKEAAQKVEGLIDDLNKPMFIESKRSSKRNAKPLKVTSNFTPAQFRQIVAKAKKKILIGDIIQVVLSQRFQVDLTTEPFNIYRALRVLNPSPYMYYLNFGDIKIVGSSPELLVRCENKIVETRPIAGTRPRGKNEQEDKRLAEELLADPKERAEHVMLVDLGRNDLGRVCQRGTVSLTDFMGIEKYSHVMHIVSNVKGELKPGKDDLDVLRAAFPAGTVSGAPKIRAMEIIEELEKQRRGPYAGCIGYFSFSGNLDTCITIRTIVVKGKKAYVQAGAGIVADSLPQKEYQETVNKAKAQIKAIELAQN
ncbi:MAG TPA: anthranilate synthase component I [Candidatus Omnitrophota bacterium]|nr:anthranilate synthase component I [Candidatus Omnitrophota bacterium]